MKNYTISAFKKRFPDDLSCLRFVLDNRYHSICPYCRIVGVTFYKITNRKAYTCGNCHEHVYPLADTIFHKSRTSLWSWFYALYLFSVSKHGVSAMELQRHLGTTYKCAWRMSKQIRSLMRQGDHMFSGVLEADEASIGGKRSPEARYTNKTTVMGAVERGGRAMAVVTGKPSLQVASNFFKDNVAVGTRVLTDESRIYGRLHTALEHTTIRHSGYGYLQSSGENHTNTIEGFWSLMKRSFDGTYHYVSPKYLQYYVDEFVFHYNRDGWTVFNDLLQRIVEVSYDSAMPVLLWGVYMVYRVQDEVVGKYRWPDSMVVIVMKMLSEKLEEGHSNTWLEEAEQTLGYLRLPKGFSGVDG